MIINHNIAALNTHRQLSINTTNTNKNIEKLSSGLRINRAGDDAAGLAISEKMRGQIRGLDQATRNAQDGISLIQTAEGALNETHSILQRMRELAVQSSNDTNTTSDREELQKELNQLTSEINRIGNTTEFNTKKLLNGDLSSTSDTGKVYAKTAEHSVTYAKGVTWTGISGETPVITDGTDDNKISFTGTAASGLDWAALDKDATQTISIERKGNELLVNIQAKDSDENELTVKADKLVHDTENKKYTYDANGVTFEISEEDFAKFTDGGKINIDLTAYSDGTDIDLSSVGTKTSYSSMAVDENGTDGPGEFGSTGIKVDSSDPNYIEGVVGVKITATDLDSGGTSGTYKVELLGKDGKAIATETFTSKDSADLTYDQHGISFEFTANDTTDFVLEQKFEISDKKVTEDKSASFQIGANQNQTLTLGVGDMRASALGIVGTGEGFSSSTNVTNGTNNTNVESALDITTSAGAANAISVLDAATTKVSSERSKLGAVQNRLEHTINNLGTTSENLTAAESRIRDVDMAKEMMEQTKNNILAQAAQAMLAQANQQPQGVLQLLR